MSGHHQNTRRNGEDRPRPNKKIKLTEEQKGAEPQEQKGAELQEQKGQEHKEARLLVLSETRKASEESLVLRTLFPTTTCPNPACDHEFMVDGKGKDVTCRCGVRCCWACQKTVQHGLGTLHWCRYGYRNVFGMACTIPDCLHLEGGCMINFASDAAATAFAARPFLRNLNLYNLRLLLIDARRHQRGIWQVSLVTDLLKLLWAFIVD